MEKQRYIRFWSRRSIVSLIGIDYPILEQSELDNLPKFYLAGFLVLGILGISFLSVFYAFDLMFNMWHAELLLSSFFSLMFFTIYIFLIQTFSKEVFPTASKVRFFNLSNLSRVGFVFMIGFLIAQPVKIFMIKSQLDIDVETYKANLYQGFCRVNQQLYANDINNLLRDKSRYTAMPASPTLAAEIAKIDSALYQIDQRIATANLKAKGNIEGSNFFIKRIAFAGNYFQSKIVVFLIIVLFFSPIVLIYSISGTSRYYSLKKKNDKDLVLQDYARFKATYSLLFERQYQLRNIVFYEPFLDPPFNTVRKPKPHYLSQADFFNNLVRQ